MNVLVTGAAGFLGACIAERGAQAGHNVWAVARGGLPDFLSKLQNIECLTCDLAGATPNAKKLDLIIHCAAAIPSREPDPEKVYSHNLAMGEAIIRCARQSAAPVIVNMSSMSAFGPLDGGEVTETTPANPQDPYGKAKLAVEGLIEDWSRETGGAAVSMRLPGMVGARSHANFMSGLAEKLIRRETVRAVNPDGRFNNIVYGYDLAAFLIERAGGFPEGHKVLTIAADEIVSVREAVERVAEAAAAPLDLISFDTAPRQPFIIRFEEIQALGYRPASVVGSIDRFVRDKRALAK